MYLRFIRTYCFNALVENRFMDEVEFAQFTDEFDVAQHLDLCNCTLFLLLRGEWAVMFVEVYSGLKKKKKKKKSLTALKKSLTKFPFCNSPQLQMQVTHGQHSWHDSQTHLEA